MLRMRNMRSLSKQVRGNSVIHYDVSTVHVKLPTGLTIQKNCDIKIEDEHVELDKCEGQRYDIGRYATSWPTLKSMMVHSVFIVFLLGGKWDKR